jgi:murein DD-endopeptidase MepM/ murein hydrolase activator NlpD
MPKPHSTYHAFFIILLGVLLATMAFTPGLSAMEAALVDYTDSTDIKNKVQQEKEVSECLFDTAHVYTGFWSNTNLFPYTYPGKANIPDSVYFVMCDSETEFCVPRNGGINSLYGPRWGAMHKGLDIHLSKGDAVKAALPGKVRYAQFNTGGYGNLVVLRHPNGLETYYAHLTDIKVKVNQWVDAGKIIGTGGNTGVEWSGDHLHFEMRYRDHAFDPLLIIDWPKKQLKADTLVLYKKNMHEAVSSSAGSAALKKEMMEASGSNSGETASASSATISQSSQRYHVVQYGETLYSIARQYGKSSLELRTLNRIGTDCKITVGQRLKLC